jgi:hypothetical protein
MDAHHNHHAHHHHLQTWTTLLDRCLVNRIPPGKFEEFAKLLSTQAPVSGAQLARIFLTPRTPAVAAAAAAAAAAPPTVSICAFDPLLKIYVDALLKLDFVDAADVLAALLENSRLYQTRHHHGSRTDDDNGGGGGGAMENIHTNDGNDSIKREDAAAAAVADGLGRETAAAGAGAGAVGEAQSSLRNAQELDETVLSALARLFLGGQRPRSRREAYQVLGALSAWMTTVIAAGTAADMMPDVAAAQTELFAVMDAVGMLAMAALENAVISKVLAGPYPKGIYKYIWACAIFLIKSKSEAGKEASFSFFLFFFFFFRFLCSLLWMITHFAPLGIQTISRLCTFCLPGSSHGIYACWLCLAFSSQAQKLHIYALDDALLSLSLQLRRTLLRTRSPFLSLLWRRRLL